MTRMKDTVRVMMPGLLLSEHAGGSELQPLVWAAAGIYVGGSLQWLFWSGQESYKEFSKQ